jgi:hypothetical protein
MKSRCCPRVCVSVCVCLCLCIPLSLLGNSSVKILTTPYVYYEITLLPVCAHIIVSFSMRSVSYQRKVGD